MNLTTTDYYLNAVKKSFLTALGTMFLALTLFAFASAFNFLIVDYPVILSRFLHITDNISQNYPQDLVFEWDGTQLSANRDSLEISWPNNIEIDATDIPSNFLYYSNSLQSPQDLDIQPYEYIFYINSTDFYYVDSNLSETWTSKSLSSIFEYQESVSLSKETVEQISDQFKTFIHSNQTKIKTVFFFTYSSIFLFSKFWFLAIETIIVILLFKLYKIKLSAKQTIILCVYVMIPTVFVNTLAEILYKNITIPLQTITFWILIIFLSYQLKLKERK